MPITLQCTCGANIRLPNHSVGRKARCQTCGGIFTVPQAQAWPDPASTANASTPRDGDVPWLPDFLDQADELAQGPPAAPEASAAGAALAAEGCLEEAGEPPKGRLLRMVEGDYRPAEDELNASGYESRGFWSALPGAVLFPLDPGSFTTLLVIGLIHAWSMLLSFTGIIGLIGNVLLLGYLCAFYLATIAHTASGEDDLPNLWISNILEDLIVPLIQFVGSFLFVSLPAFALIIGALIADRPVPWDRVKVVGVLGLLFWPVVILGLAIGGSFRGLWPHTIVRTALAAPIAYAAVCAAVIVAVGLRALPHLAATWTVGTLFTRWQFIVIAAGLNAYSGIVVMRVIGLFYRHHKDKFPWSAE